MPKLQLDRDRTQTRQRGFGFNAFPGNQCGIMSPIDAITIDIKSQKSAPGDRHFCYKSLNETQNSASSTMHRCQEGRDMPNMWNIAFRPRIYGKTEHRTCISREMVSSNMQYSQSESTISACDTSGHKWAVGACETGKVAVARKRVRFLSCTSRQSG